MTYEELCEHCYECSGYGDDYSFDEETGELVPNCEDCWVTAERKRLIEEE